MADFAREKYKMTKIVTRHHSETQKRTYETTECLHEKKKSRKEGCMAKKATYHRLIL